MLHATTTLRLATGMAATYNNTRAGCMEHCIEPFVIGKCTSIASQIHMPVASLIHKLAMLALSDFAATVVECTCESGYYVGSCQSVGEWQAA
jgi:hypothetical protein